MHNDRDTPRERIWSVDEHLADILGRLTPLEPVELPLLDAQGCALAEDLVVPGALPPFDNSSMDGYAVRVADLAGAGDDSPRVLRVIGDAAAGDATPPPIHHGEAVRIMTGAPLPPGAEAVVPVEWTDAGLGRGPAETMPSFSADPQRAGGEVRIYRAAERGAHVRVRGSDVGAGESALAAGARLGPPQIGLLAATGIDRVLVRPRARVTVVATGSELVPPGQPLPPGSIHDSNSFALTAAARDAGADARRISSVADEAGALREAITGQLPHCDVIVTSGGVSVGAYDVVKEALGEPVGEGETGGVEFRRLAMQPGKPQGFGLIGPAGVPLLALPGNPVSAYVSFELFVRPVIRTLMGLAPAHRETVRARCTEPITGSPAGRRQFLRGRYRDGTVTPVGRSGSHLVKALAHADALIVVPEEATEVARDADVAVILLG